MSGSPSKQLLQWDVCTSMCTIQILDVVKQRRLTRGSFRGRPRGLFMFGS